MKKIWAVLLSLVMVLALLPTFASAEAEYVEVSTKEEFKEILESNGDKNIIVTRDIIYTCQVNDVGDYWITLGRGEKTLNLNGKAVELNAETGVETTMIRVRSGASLIIDDTSGDNSGKLFCYGKMSSPRDDDGIPRYFNDAVKYRNVLEVDGGTVTINGGTLEAGRSKKYWIYDGRDIYNYKYQTDYALQGGILAWTIGVRYDGYAWQQVNGDCITVNDGVLMVNDGIFLGRGFSNLETYVDERPAMDIHFSRSACLRLLGGSTTINGGTFWGRGNANVFGASKDANITVKNGTFSTNHLRVIEVPTISVSGTGWYEPNVIGTEKSYMGYHYASEPGSVGLTSDMLNPQRNTAELNGETLPVSEWSKLNATGNDGSATVVITHHMSNSDRRNFMSGDRSAGKKEIKNLNISGTNAYGMTLSPDVLSCNVEGVRSISVEWYHNDEPCDDETTMVAGKYQAKVAVILDSNYIFSDSPNFSIMGDRVSDYDISSTKRTATLWSKVYNLECNHSYNEDEYLRFDNDKHFMQCSVCKKVLIDEEHYFGDGEPDGSSIIYKCRGCDFSYGEVDDGKIRIDYLNINIPNPKTGYVPEYYGVISGEGVRFANGGDEFTKNGIRWGLYVNDSGLGENDLFASGMGYRATIYLRADEGYTFSKDQNAQYNPVVIVNGEQAEYETDGELMTVKYEVNAPEITVSYIDITGIDFPEIGEMPDCEIESAEPQYYNAKTDSGSVTWYEDGEYMYKTDTFKAGKEYQIEMYIDTIRSGWDYTARFAENLSGVTVDGFAVNENNIRRLNDTTVVVAHTFPVLEEDKVEEPEKPAETEKPVETEKPQETEKPAEKPAETENPQEAQKTTFTDISKGQYYYDAVLWAVEQGITGGTSATTFSPDAPCTRAQVVTFLHRMVASPEPAAIDMPFNDVKDDAYYYKPVKWAVGSNITGGTSATTFSPDITCTRGQVVTFLWRTAGQPEAKSSKCNFTDVKSDSYYYKAVLWAVEQGITGGTSATTFSPDDSCTRGQVVTFLYRFINKQ